MAEASAIATDSTDFLQALRATRALVIELERAGFTNEGVTLFAPTNTALHRSVQSGAAFVLDDVLLRNHLFPRTMTLERLCDVSSITSWGGLTFEVRCERGSVDTNNRRRSESFVSIGNGYSRSFLHGSGIQGNVVNGITHTIDRPLLPEPAFSLTTAGPGSGNDAGSTDGSNADSTANNSELLIVGSLVLALLLLVVCLAMFMVCRPPAQYKDGTVDPRTGVVMINGQYRIAAAGPPSPSAGPMHGRLMHPQYPQYPQGRWQWQDAIPGDNAVGPLTSEFDHDMALADALQLGDDNRDAALSPGLMPSDYLMLASPPRSLEQGDYPGGDGGFAEAQMPTWTHSPEPDGHDAQHDYIGIAGGNPNYPAQWPNGNFEGPQPETRQSMIRDAAARWGGKKKP